MTLTAILERLKELSAPDRELDAMLEVLLVQNRVWVEDGTVIYARNAAEPYMTTRIGTIDPGVHSRHFYLSWEDGYPRYTASIDAALGLVERCLPGTWWLFGKGRMKPEELLYGAQLLPEGDIDTIIGEGEAATPPLAILTALVSALIARKEQQ